MVADTESSESTYETPPDRRCAQIGKLSTEMAVRRHAPRLTPMSNCTTSWSPASYEALALSTSRA